MSNLSLHGQAGNGVAKAGISPPLRICHIVSGDLWAGAEAQALLMMTMLHRSSRFTVSAITLNDGHLSQRIAECGIPISIIPEKTHSFLAIALIASRIFDGNRPDIVHTHRYKENLIAALATRGGQCSRLVQSVHGVLEQPDGRLGLKARVRNSLNMAVGALCYDRILAVSRDIESRLRQAHASARIAYVSNALDLNAVRVTTDRNRIRKSLGCEPQDILFGTIGRLVPIKGLDVMLDVAARLVMRTPHARFVLVGDGPLAGPLRSQAGRLGIVNRVTFAGHRTDVPNILSAIDVFLMTSWHEGTPIALLEAMALERPIVATRVGGIPEVVEDGVSGLLASAGDRSEIAELCARLVASSTLRHSMGAAGFKRVQLSFSSQALFRHLESIYEEVVSSA